MFLPPNRGPDCLKDLVGAPALEPGTLRLEGFLAQHSKLPARSVGSTPDLRFGFLKTQILPSVFYEESYCMGLYGNQCLPLCI
jgi:hypothetical protein